MKSLSTTHSRPGVSAETLRAAGIRITDTPERGCLEIPYHDLKGQPTGFSRWRLARERVDGQKYHQQPGTGTRAYIPPQFCSRAPGGDLVIVEGEFKALALIDAGIKAIGLPSFNTYTNDKDGDRQLLAGLAEAIEHTKPDCILFLGDTDTSTNAEFARHALFLAEAVKPVPVLLPRIPMDGPGKGIDDCREALGPKKFNKFWAAIRQSAESIDLKSKFGSLAVRLLKHEAGAIRGLTGPEQDKCIRRIAEMGATLGGDPIAFDRLKVFVEKVLGISRTSFTAAVKEARAVRRRDVDERSTNSPKSPQASESAQGGPEKPGGEQGPSEDESLFPNPPATPWENPVTGAVLLDELAAMLNRYVVLPLHGAYALALFILQTYCAECFDAAPYINLSSPEKRCGKTLTLRLLASLCDRALPAANCSEASVFRALDKETPCLLIDEVDTFFRDKPELRGILNAGNVRADAAVMRTVEVRRGGTTDYEVRRYSVFGPKVFSGIGKLADTLADRCIDMPMRRKCTDEVRVRFRRREYDPEPLRMKCRRWANDNAAALIACRPELPTELNDRAADLWEPLLAVADIAGEQWPERAARAALALSGENPDNPPASLGERLLTDICKIFAQVSGDHLTSVDLCARLAEMEESGWAEIRKGQPINPNKLAAMLGKTYGVRSRKVRTSPTTTAQGYSRQDFMDAWQRYTPAVLAASKWNNGTTTVNIEPNPLSEVEQPDCLFHLENPIPTNDDGACSIVPLPVPENGAGQSQSAGLECPQPLPKREDAEYV